MDKESVSIRLDTKKMDRLRNAIWHVGRGLTISALLEEAVDTISDRLEVEYNGGKPFPSRESELPKSHRRPRAKTT
jgi:hypothetical protein